MEVVVEKGESLERALKRFRKQCQRDGLFAEVKRRCYYEKPSEKRKRAAEKARRRELRRN